MNGDPLVRKCVEYLDQRMEAEFQLGMPVPERVMKYLQIRSLAKIAEKLDYLSVLSKDRS